MKESDTVLNGKATEQNHHRPNTTPKQQEGRGVFTDEAELLRVVLQNRLSGRRTNKVKIFDMKREKKKLVFFLYQFPQGTGG
jgi:hypothetical protein